MKLGEIMPTKEKLPYGSWPSPITARLVSTSGSGHAALPREVQVDPTGVYWIEARPEEGGRYVIQHLDPLGSTNTITPEGFSVRTRVHEYGGGSFLLWQGTIFFSNESDQRLYRQDPSSLPKPITPLADQGEHLRYANGCITPDGKSLIYVCEQHATDGKVHNFLIKLSPDGSDAPITLHAEHDFYANPRISPDGKKLIWLTWDHPQMPWDGTDLWLAELNSDQLGKVAHIVGGQKESIFQPDWGLNGEIYFVSDKTGWWNIYRTKDTEIEALTETELEFGVPMWSLADRSYVLVQDDYIVGFYKDNGSPGIAIIDLNTGTMQQLQGDFNYMVPSIDAGPDQRVWFLAGSPHTFPGLTYLDLETGALERVLEVRDFDFPREYVSIPEQITFKSPSGGLSYAYYYLPTHPNLTGMDSELAPLIVMGHGGPTGAARPYLNLEVQFWTSRGFAVVDVDYSGSVGYGRSYRERLRGQFGIADVADCVEAARHLAETGRADPDRLLITGGSAGGYIVLCALTGYDVFSAGASYYGIADLLVLAQDSHKFESMYEISLIGPYPEYAETYHQRSPLNYADKLNCPVILFQGLEDRVVPPSQSEIFVDALKKNGIQHKYITFEGEGHGFRRSENIQIAFEEELAFYRDVLGI
jgi:dipeptidyl aminopeptidase/acylaminoacyl peptidase